MNHSRSFNHAQRMVLALMLALPVQPGFSSDETSTNAVSKLISANSQVMLGAIQLDASGAITGLRLSSTFADPGSLEIVATIKSLKELYIRRNPTGSKPSLTEQAVGKLAGMPSLTKLHLSC